MKISLYVLALIIITALLALMVIPALLKKKDHKELFVVVSLFSIGFMLNFLLILGAKLPNPNKLVIKVIQVFLSK